MPVEKWVYDRVSGKRPKVTWTGWKKAETGHDMHVALVEKALKDIDVCLGKAAPSQATDKYLKGSSIGNKQMFEKGLARLKQHVAEYINPNGKCSLYVAYQNVTALASSKPPPPGYSEELNLGDNLLPRNLIIIHDPFVTSYVVENKRKSLSYWGQCTTVLHELTHSLMYTVDVWYKNLQYGISPADPPNAVTKPDDCEKLAKAKAKLSGYRPHISWLNAENWTLAIAAFHPTLGGKSIYK